MTQVVRCRQVGFPVGVQVRHGSVRCLGCLRLGLRLHVCVLHVVVASACPTQTSGSCLPNGSHQFHCCGPGVHVVGEEHGRIQGTSIQVQARRGDTCRHRARGCVPFASWPCCSCTLGIFSRLVHPRFVVLQVPPGHRVLCRRLGTLRVRALGSLRRRWLGLQLCATTIGRRCT